jgi:mono/diheme cytochrome c family protein
MRTRHGCRLGRAGALLGALGITVGLAAGAAAQQAPFPIPAWSRTTATPENTGPLAERGAAVFNNWCSACHSRGPANAPGTTSLQHKYQGSVPAALEDRTDLTAELVELFVRNGVATMPFYRKTEIDDQELAALAAYLTRPR